jgi:DNA repair exonuclease SbcCD ATPase subunit
MIIHKIKITNFKSIYGPQEFDFDKLNGLVKLVGPVGAGKTTLAEAILFGLYGTIKGQNNPDMISWNETDCEIEMTITSKGKELYICRTAKQPLIVKVDNQLLAASSKKGTQQILEEELFDVPTLAMTKMCIISFSQFNSLASMSAADTKKFLDDIFGFKVFSDYNEQAVSARKIEQNESIKLQAIYDEDANQIEHLKAKKAAQQATVIASIDMNKLNSDRENYVNKGIEQKKLKEDKSNEFDIELDKINKNIREEQRLITEAATLGRQAKSHYQTFKDGICPTCGQKIDETHIEKYKNEVQKYADQYNEHDNNRKNYDEQYRQLNAEKNTALQVFDDKMTELKNNVKLQHKDFDTVRPRIEEIFNNFKVVIRGHNDEKELIKANWQEVMRVDKPNFLQIYNADYDVSQSYMRYIELGGDPADLFTNPEIGNYVSLYCKSIRQYNGTYRPPMRMTHSRMVVS